MRRHFFNGWIPLHRIAVLANLHGGGGKFRKVAAGRNWSLLLVRRDDSIPSVPPADRPTLREAIDAAAADIIREHNATYHLGRSCRENGRGECVDLFGPTHPSDSARDRVPDA